jgi:invasion protein IalB
MRFQVMRLSAAALAMSVLLVGAASAQAPKAGAPAVPEAPAQPAPTLPSKLDLVSPEPIWAKLCAKDNSACATMRDFSTSADQPPAISVNVVEQQGEEKHRSTSMHLQVPIGSLLRPGLRIIFDKGEPLEAKYDLCGPSACYATADLTAKTLEALKKAQTMTVMARFPAPGEPSGHELSFNIPVKDFAIAFDGKPTDPKVLEQQHEALQQQLQKKAEEQRKMLEKQQSAAPAAPAPAAPAAPAPAAPAPAAPAPAAPAK